MTEKCSFAVEVAGVAYIVNEMPSEKAKKTYEELAKELIKSECMKLELDENAA